MNTANFPNHGAPVPGGDKLPAQMQAKSENMQLLQRHIAAALQNQAPFTGWQASVSLQDRISKVWQLFTSIRLTASKQDIGNTLNSMMKLEEQTLRNAKDKPDYENKLKEKLGQMKAVREQRMQQEAMMSHGGHFGGAGMPGNPQNPMQPGFSPMAPQQMAMGMNGPPRQMGMPQPQPPYLQHPSQRFMPSSGNESVQLTPQELEQGNRQAEQMARKLTPADLEKINMNAQNLTPEQRQNMARKGLDNVTYFCRLQVYRQMRQQKLARLQMAANAQNTLPDNGNNFVMGMPQRPVPQSNVGMQGNSTMPGGQVLGPGFMGNVDQIQGQQVDGLRSQKAGHLVVPATASQMMSHSPFPTQPNMFQSEQPPPGSQGNVNPTLLAQQQQRGQQPQNAQHLQREAQAQKQAQARAQAAATAKAQIAMSSQPHPQQTPPMPMLNRPMGPGQGMPPHGSPQTQPTAMNQDQLMPSSSPSNIPQGIPPHFQNQLAQMPPEQVALMLQNYQRRFGNNQGMARPPQGPIPVPQPVSESGQAMTDPNARPPGTMPPQMPGVNGPLAQNQPLQGAQTAAQHRQQQELQRLQLARQRPSLMEMNEQQLREMDRVSFPEAMLNSQRSIAIPKNIKTWGQLKAWVSQNPRALGIDDGLAKVQKMQQYHFTQSMNAQRDSMNRNQSGQNFPANVPNVSVPNQQPFIPGGQQQPPQVPPNFPPVRPITANEIQFVRQKFGPAISHWNDDMVRQFIEKNRQKQWMAARNKAAAAAAAQGHGPQVFNQAPTTQPPVAAPQQSPVPTTQAPQPAANQTQKSPATGSKAQGGKAARGAGAKQAAKNLKRPSADDGAETQNQGAQQPGQVAATQQQSAPGAARSSTSPALREQSAAMSAQQKAQLDAHLRQKAGQKQLITKAQAEEAWKRLPEKIRQLYAELVQRDNVVVPTAMTNEQRSAMANQLRGFVDCLARMDSLVLWISRYPGQEKHLRNLLQMRMLLMKQFTGPDWTLVDQFTITPDYVNATTTYARKLFGSMLNYSGARQGQKPPVSQPPSVAPGPAPPAHAAPAATMPQLNASNLQQLEQQQEELQRAKRAKASQVPAAPTSSQPPFPLGAPSPQGVPQAYGPDSLTRDKLHLPPAKRRKQNQGNKTTPTTTPTQTAMSTPQGGKPALSEAKMQPSVAPSFKCSVADCQYHIKGFASQSALDNHVEEEHKVETPIANALEFALESYRIGLGVDKKADDFFNMQPPGQQQSSKPGAAKSKPDVRVDGVTLGTDQMDRTASRPGLKSAASPAFSKGSTASNLKRAQSKDIKKEAGNLEDSPQKPSEDKDAWDHSPISLDTIRSAFDFSDHPELGLTAGSGDFITLPEEFMKFRSKETPQSTDTGANTQTPKDSDVSKDDEFEILGQHDDGSWIPSDWVNLPGELEDGLLVQDPWEEINWDAIDEKEMNMDLDTYEGLYSF